MIFFFKWKACDENEKSTSVSYKLEKLYENPKIEENEKQLSKVPKVVYNKFLNALECDPESNFCSFFLIYYC